MKIYNNFNIKSFGHTPQTPPNNTGSMQYCNCQGHTPGMMPPPQMGPFHMRPPGFWGPGFLPGHFMRHPMGPMGPMGYPPPPPPRQNMPDLSVLTPSRLDEIQKYNDIKQAEMDMALVTP